ncbi:hypothetical protein K458DRAFT_387940 [Lentithecium fluviatile CBS 122367]|uniref:Uncharacterized protein n=1 Tax=Lentithecium fluviatile CBS 122367 TaxID=1168545 RepID=A0A6G1J4A9_9PLEO|nr:hypothetical protein K458DRAFT_387940 [Lentithecium fluviatile CBS 122367]
MGTKHSTVSPELGSDSDANSTRPFIRSQEDDPDPTATLIREATTSIRELINTFSPAIHSIDDLLDNSKLKELSNKHKSVLILGRLYYILPLYSDYSKKYRHFLTTTDFPLPVDDEGPVDDEWLVRTEEWCVRSLFQLCREGIGKVGEEIDALFGRIVEKGVLSASQKEELHAALIESAYKDAKDLTLALNSTKQLIDILLSEYPPSTCAGRILAIRECIGSLLKPLVLWYSKYNSTYCEFLATSSSDDNSASERLVKEWDPSEGLTPEVANHEAGVYLRVVDGMKGDLYRRVVEQPDLGDEVTGELEKVLIRCGTLNEGQVFVARVLD